MRSDFVVAQLDAVLNEIPPLAAKSGALGYAANVVAMTQRAETFPFPLVVDPVMINKHGQPLIVDDAVVVLARKLLPAAFHGTPNLSEASKLASIQVTKLRAMEKAAAIIAESGAKHVLVKGGHPGPAHTLTRKFPVLWQGNPGSIRQPFAALRCCTCLFAA